MVKSSIAQTRSRHRASWGGLIALAALLVPASPAGAASNGFASLKVVAESSTTPTALIDTAGSLVCGTAALSGAGGELSQYPDSYTLDFGDGVHVSGNAGTSTCDEPALPPSIEHVYDAAGTYTVTMTVVSHVCSINCGPGEPDTVSASVTVPGQAQALPSPQANLDPLGPVIGGAPYALAFGQASFAPPGAQLVEELYRWGDGTSTILSPDSLGQFIPQVHTYQHPGTYLTTLRVRTDENVTDLDSEIVTISRAPSALSPPDGNVMTSNKTLFAETRLTRSDLGTPEVGKLVNFYTANGSFVCGDFTGINGFASCTGNLGANVQNAENKGIFAQFLGDYDTVGALSAVRKPTVNATNTSNRAGTGAGVKIAPLPSRLGGLRLLRVHGNATGRAARVMVTIERWAGGSCRIVGGAKVRAFRGNCEPAGFRPASGTRHWSLALGRRLRAGSYQVYAYPVNAAGRPGSIAGTSFQVQ
jgi:PKD repeat protein